VTDLQSLGHGPDADRTASPRFRHGAVGLLHGTAALFKSNVTTTFGLRLGKQPRSNMVRYGQQPLIGHPLTVDC